MDKKEIELDIKFPLYREGNIIKDADGAILYLDPGHEWDGQHTEAVGDFILEALNAYHDNGWRDVKDELPKISAAYFISIADSDFVHSAWYIARKEMFVKLDGSESFEGVTAWMPQVLRYQPEDK